MKIIKLIFTCFVYFMVFCSADCKKKTSSKCHYLITIKNNSNQSVYLNYSEEYPDTSINCDYHYGEKINSQEKSEISDQFDCLELRFDKFNNLQFFFIDSTIFNNATCDSIKAYNLYLKRVQVNLDQVNNFGWTIAYP